MLGDEFPLLSDASSSLTWTSPALVMGLLEQGCRAQAVTAKITLEGFKNHVGMIGGGTNPPNSLKQHCIELFN